MSQGPISASMIQSISTEMFDSHDNEMLAALDETMRRTTEEEEQPIVGTTTTEEKTEDPPTTTVYSTKDATRKLKRSGSKLGSSRGSSRLGGSSSSMKGKEVHCYDGDEEDLEEKPAAEELMARPV